MKFLRHLSWIFRALLFVALFLFALKNTDPVTLRFYSDQILQLPLVLAVLHNGGAATLVFLLVMLNYKIRITGKAT